MNSSASSVVAQLWRVASPFVYTVLMAAFTRFATLGYLTPEQATNLTKWVMDGLVTGAPLVLGAFLAWQRTQKQLVQTTDTLPGVLGVAVTPELDKKIDSPTVTTPVRLVSEIAANPPTP